MSSTGSVRTAVIPAAGLGTRFLPATKAVPKEMLTVVDRPAIQWVVEEAVAAGIEHVVIVTNPAKKAVEDHFRPMAELEALLEAKGRPGMLAEVVRIGGLADIQFVHQEVPLGLGHAVSRARHHVGGEPFAVLLPDQILPDGGAALRRMVEVADALDTSVVALREVGRAEISAYGCAAPMSVDDGVVEIDEIVEKPSPEEAPSNLAVASRYVFRPEIFDRLEQTAPGLGGEIQLTDAMAGLIRRPGIAGDSRLHGVIVEWSGYDTGRRLEWLRANLELSLDDPVHGADVAEMVTRVVGPRGLARPAPA